MDVLSPAKELQQADHEIFLRIFQKCTRDEEVKNQYLGKSKAKLATSQDRPGTLCAALLCQLRYLQEQGFELFRTDGTQLDAAFIDACETQWWDRFPGLKEIWRDTPVLGTLRAYASIFKCPIIFKCVISEDDAEGMLIYPLNDNLVSELTSSNTCKSLDVVYHAQMYWSFEQDTSEGARCTPHPGGESSTPPNSQTSISRKKYSSGRRSAFARIVPPPVYANQAALDAIEPVSACFGSDLSKRKIFEAVVLSNKEKFCAMLQKLPSQQDPVTSIYYSFLKALKCYEEETVQIRVEGIALCLLLKYHAAAKSSEGGVSTQLENILKTKCPLFNSDKELERVEYSLLLAALIGLVFPPQRAVAIGSQLGDLRGSVPMEIEVWTTVSEMASESASHTSNAIGSIHTYITNRSTKINRIGPVVTLMTRALVAILPRDATMSKVSQLCTQPLGTAAHLGLVYAVGAIVHGEGFTRKSKIFGPWQIVAFQILQALTGHDGSRDVDEGSTMCKRMVLVAGLLSDVRLRMEVCCRKPVFVCMCQCRQELGSYVVALT